MRFLSLLVLLAGSSIPSLAAAPPADVTAMERATQVMGDCAKIADEITAMKVPAGHERARAAAFTNAQVGGETGSKLIAIEPVHEQFIKQMEARTLRLEACGKTYKAAIKDAADLEEKMGQANMSEQEAAAVKDRYMAYGAARQTLKKSIMGLSNDRQIQSYVSKILQEYFLKHPKEQGGKVQAMTAAAPPPAKGVFDAELAQQLRDVQKQEAQTLKEAAQKAAEGARSGQQALQELQARQNAAAASKAAVTTSAPRTASPAPQTATQAPPLSTADTQAVLNWIAGQVASDRQPYCYRDSYGRGVGVPVSSCASDRDKDGALCYPKCKQDFYGVGPVCWSHCPSGYRDMGAICHIDKALLTEGSMHCGPWYHFGTDCHMECPSGYTNIGVACALDTPHCPPGFSGTGLDPMKNSYGRGAGYTMNCTSSQDYDAGLCYSPCKGGYHGVGPVCWMSCPSGKTNCGAGCANSTASCVTNTASMVLAPAILAINIASMGTASEATSAESSAFQSIKSACVEFKTAYQTQIDAAKAVYTIGSTAYRLAQTTDRWVTDYTANFAAVTTPEVAAELHSKLQGHPEAETWVKRQYALQNLNLMMKNDLGETAANALAVASNFDPTGVTGVVSAFMNPVCSTAESFPTVSFGGSAGPVAPVVAPKAGPGTPWVVNGAREIFRRANGAWQKLPGAALDIGVGADGSAWVVGTAAASGGHRIYKWNGSDWAQVDGGAVRISVAPDGSPWVINEPGEIFHRTGGGWQKLPGTAKDIGVGAKGSVWVIGADARDGGYSISNWTGSNWAKTDGGAVRIAVGPDGSPWVVNSADNILHRTGNAWQKMPGAAKDIAVGADGSVWITGTDSGIYYWGGSDWKRVDGGAASISVQ
jgi:hypothetical protein